MSNSPDLLAHFVALTLGNLGRMHEANRWWRTANRLAADSGDPYTIAWVKGCELARAFYENRPAATLIQLAEQVDSLTLAAPAAAVTELLVGKTQLLTALGRHDEVEPTLERFREAVATLPSAPSEQNDSWLAWAENRLRFAESFAYSYQGRLPQAEEAHQRAIALYPSWYRRGPIKIELQRALAFIRSGDVTAGIRHAHTIISGAGPANHDWPIIEFGREVLQRVPPGEHDGIVAEFRDYLALPKATT